MSARYTDPNVTPPADAELLAKRWPAKRDSSDYSPCNSCNKPYKQGDTIAVCPKKPWWYHKQSKAWVNNYIHGACADALETGMGRAQQQQAVKPYSFAPKSSDAKGDLNRLLSTVRDAINAYLGDEFTADDAYAHLAGETPF